MKSYPKYTYILLLILVTATLSLSTSCKRDKEEEVIHYLEVTYATLNGSWRLTEWQGEALEEEQMVHVTFHRREHTFILTSNLNSMYPREYPGSFTVEQIDILDPKQGAKLTGVYDFRRGEWSTTYRVYEMTDNTMKWEPYENPDEVFIFTRIK